MDLLSAWQEWDADSPPYILKADADVLKSPGDVVTYRSWDEARQHFPETVKKRLHLGLLPGPFMGDMLNASIYVLTLHPGIDKYDYYAEYQKPDFRQVLQANLKQERLEGIIPFTLLDPQFEWHPGFKYWHSRKLDKVILELAKGRGVRYEVARAELGEKLAVIQLFPYHSAEFNYKWVSLPSVRLAGEFVRDIVVERVRAKQAICIAVLGVKHWEKYLPKDLTEEQGVIRYDTTLARAASLNPNAPKSPGGRAILCHLGVDVQSK